MDIEKLWFQAADECGHCPVDTRHRFAALVLEEAAMVCESVGSAHSDYPFAKLAAENCARRIRAISTTTPTQEHNNG
jgi:hypothetical protein